MKKLILLLLLLPSLIKAQSPSGVVTARYNGNWYEYTTGYLMVNNGGFAIPYRDTNWTALRAGFITYRPADGLVYVSTGNYSGQKWKLSAPLATDAWYLLGNAGTTAANFLGTTDDSPIRFRLNNLEHGRIKPPSTAVLGSTSGSSIYLGLNAGYKDTVNGNTNIGIGAYVLSEYPTTSPSSTASGNIGIGHEALKNYVGTSPENNVAIGFRSQTRNIDAFRNTSVGLNTHHNLRRGARNTAVGALSAENIDSAYNNDSYGESSLRAFTIGVGNVVIGNNAMFYTSSGILGVTITGSSSDWTTGTVTFSTPVTSPFGFTTALQATGTVIISGGQIIGVTITEMGRGYNKAATATFTGDGTSVTATLTISEPSYNTVVGIGAMFSNRSGYGNVAIGASAGGGLTSVEPYISVMDSLMTFIGFNAGRNLANPLTARLSKSTAIGYNAKVGQSNALILGGTGADQPNVGIGTETPSTSHLLDVNGQSIFRDTIHSAKIARFYTSGVTANLPALVVSNLSPTMNGAPTVGSGLLDNAALKIYSGSGTDHGLTLYRVRASNFGGAAITTYRSNSDDINVKSAVLSAQSLFQIVNYGVAGDNSTLNAGAMIRTRVYGTPRSTFVPTYFEVQLVDTFNSTLRTKISVRPNETLVSDSTCEGGAFAVPSSAFTIISDKRGFMTPRLNTTQMNAIASPANGLMIYNTDSTKHCYYNGSTWVCYGSGGGGGGGGGLTGTGVNGEIAVWTGGTSLDSYGDFLFDNTTSKFTLGSGDNTGIPTPIRFSSILDNATTSGHSLHAAFKSTQTVATTGSIQSVEGYSETTHATGTVGFSIGTVGNSEHSGAGDVVSVRGMQAGALVTGTGNVDGLTSMYVAGPTATSTGNAGLAHGIYIAPANTNAGGAQFDFYYGIEHAAPITGSVINNRKVAYFTRSMHDGTDSSVAFWSEGGRIRFEGNIGQSTNGTDSMLVITSTGYVRKTAPLSAGVNIATSNLMATGNRIFSGNNHTHTFSIDSFNVMTIKRNNITRFMVSSVGTISYSPNGTSYASVFDGSVQLYNGNQEVTIENDSLVANKHAGYRTNINSSLTENNWITKGYADSTEITDHMIMGFQGLGSTLCAQTLGYTQPTSSTNSILVDGTQRWVAVYLPKTETIQGIAFIQGTQGNYTADNNNRMGIYTIDPATGTLTHVVSSTNNGNLWKATANSLVKEPISTPTKLTKGTYFVCFIYNNSAQVTAPSIYNGTAPLNGVQVTLDFPNSIKLCGTVAAQTDITTTTRASSTITTTIAPPWIAFYK